MRLYVFTMRLYVFTMRLYVFFTFYVFYDVGLTKKLKPPGFSCQSVGIQAGIFQQCSSFCSLPFSSLP